jgi:hypothetical protein
LCCAQTGEFDRVILHVRRSRSKQVELGVMSDNDCKRQNEARYCSHRQHLLFVVDGRRRTAFSAIMCTKPHFVAAFFAFEEA